MRKKIQIFDTTLRDGTQAEKVCFSADDKLKIARSLDEFGIDYIEGGWPGSNPKDLQFFEKAKSVKFQHAKIVAFGSTMRAHSEPDQDSNLQALLRSETLAVAIFGKSWLLHVEKALQITPEMNLHLIAASVAFLKAHGKEVIYDAEHFFDGYKHDPNYAMQTLLAAQEGGADILVLCDTNGGTLPSDLAEIIRATRRKVNTPLGIHAHNDSEVAVANTIIAVENGCLHVQGTINGFGERCGNANLCSVIPNLHLKKDYLCIPEKNLYKLTALSHFISEIANLTHPGNLPFVGKSAFAHKGGVHVSAVIKDAQTYEHIDPTTVGNERRVLVSDLSGRSNVFYKANEMDIQLKQHAAKVPDIVSELKARENRGYQYEAAEGSFKLLVNKMIGDWQDFFSLEGFRVIIEKNASGATRSEATIRLNVNGQIEHTAAEGNGPVHALDRALRKALVQFYPEIEKMQLADYKVRVLNGENATGAEVRVLIDSTANGKSWGTVGVSENIIEASWQALMDGFSFFLASVEAQKKERTPEPIN
ncbi:MAG TPA: citramalate synthase [bacterium]